jgi:hypothetical protein
VSEEGGVRRTEFFFVFLGNQCFRGSVRLYCTLTDAQLTSQGQPLLGIICSREIGALSSPPAFVLQYCYPALDTTNINSHTHTHAHIHKHTHTHVSTNQPTFVHTYLHTNSLAGLLPWIEWRSRVSQVFLQTVLEMTAGNLRRRAFLLMAEMFVHNPYMLMR